MESNEQYERAIQDFAAVLYSKGYRGRYSLSKAGESRNLMQGLLSACLKQMIEAHSEGKDALGFDLKTQPSYDANLQCSFRLEFDQTKGFLVTAMDINDSVSQQNRHYEIRHNHVIPGANAITGLFPKKKPWDDFLKGRFRP
jgi:hypothetical protein